jgi:uncharacterized protein
LQLLKKFCQAWDSFTGVAHLTRLRTQELSWLEVFETVGKYVCELKESPLVLMMDEIQWIAKRNIGFVSQLKEAWVQWEMNPSVKLIISGSSNRFFEDKTGGDAKILRGMRTHGDIWVRPFSLWEVRKYFFSKWTDEEICLIYMMTGGVPYYLCRVPKVTNFIRAVNETFFTRRTIFLEEIEEILDLEFNQTS